MAKSSGGKKRRFGAEFKQVDLGGQCNWPSRRVSGEWWQELAEHVRGYPEGEVTSWGIPFTAGSGRVRRVIVVARRRPAVTIKLRGLADYVCLLHEWRQLPDAVHSEDPQEGLLVAEYELTYAGGGRAVLPVRARFEVGMAESPGPPWTALSFGMPSTVDPSDFPPEVNWGRAQTGLKGGPRGPLVCAIANPHPDRRLISLTIRGVSDSPHIVAGLTLYRGASHPLQHLPRRTYGVTVPGGQAEIEEADLDLGVVARIEQTDRPRGKRWLKSPYVGVHPTKEPPAAGESLLEVVGAEDATISVKVKGRKRPLKFSLGEAFHSGASTSGRARLDVLGAKRQWMKVVVSDSSTGKPTPVRIHFSGSRGQYIAPYGHHAQINGGWFMDYGADVVAGGRSFAYVHGEFTTDLPVGDLYVEMYKGFEYKPIRTKVTVKPGQKVLKLTIQRAMDWRSAGWVTADTHVHFISPHTAWLQAQAEGVNVVNLLASQWGRLFTNVGDITGRPGVVENDTIVYVGTENRNHMLGHMSMLGTQGLPVYPMCCGGPGESWVGDPDFMMLAEWAHENKRKGGVVIRPHYPFCGHTEDPVPILKGLVDALEIRGLRGGDFSTQEWYRYLNCGYRVAVVGGTDKMGAYCPLGWMRTYAALDPQRPFNYRNWAKAVRAGRTFSTNGPLIDITVDGRGMGETIEVPASGGTLEVQAHGHSVWPLGKIEIVHNGRVVAAERASGGAPALKVKAAVKVRGSGWIAARCSGHARHPAGHIAAHTSPVYVKCGQTRAFDGPAAQHMLGLVEGGMEYLQKLATVFDEPARKRMVRLFKEVQRELKGRLLVEHGEALHHGSGAYHRHGHGEADHHH